MYATSAGWRDALSGDIGVGALCAVWLGSAVTVPDLEIDSGTLTTELADGQIQTRLTLTVADEDATLYTGWDSSPLDVVGHRLRVASTITAGEWSETVPEGTFRVNSIVPEPVAPWRLYLPAGVWVRGAQSLQVSAGDMLDQIADEDLMAAMSPRLGASIGSEIERLAAGIVPVGDSIDALDGPVPSSITYDSDRLGSMVALGRAAGVVLWVDRVGLLQAIPTTGSGSVWRVPMDALVSAVPSSDRSGLSNAWVVTSETDDGQSLRGQAVEESGPLRFGGPFGRVPTSAHSPILTSNSQCSRAARTNRATDQAGRRRVISVECGVDHALDVMDTAVLELPTGDVSGLVVRISRSLTGRGMTVGVSVDWEALNV